MRPCVGFRPLGPAARRTGGMKRSSQNGALDGRYSEYFGSTTAPTFATADGSTPVASFIKFMHMQRSPPRRTPTVGALGATLSPSTRHAGRVTA